MNARLILHCASALTLFAFLSGCEEMETAQQAATHANIVDEGTRDGSRWISETLVKGESVLRMMVISYLTEERHLLELQSALTKAANNLKSQAQTEA